MSEERWNRITIEIDATDRELVVVEASEHPNIEHFARKTSEVADFNGEEPAYPGRLRIRPSLKYPSPGVLAHSMDTPVKMQGAAFVMSEANVLDYLPVIVKYDADTIMRALNADATIYIVSMPASFSLRARRGKLRTGPSRLASTVFKGASTPPRGSLNLGDSRVIANTCFSREKFLLRSLISYLSDALGLIRCDSLADAGDLDGEKEVEIDALVDSGIGVIKADMVNDLGTVAESGMENNCKKFYEQSFEDVKLDVHEGSSDRKKFTGCIRYYASAAGDEQCLLADCVSWRKGDIYDTTKYEFKPAAAQYLALIATVGKAGEKLCKFGDDGADSYYELETAVPLENKVTGPDQALDG